MSHYSEQAVDRLYFVEIMNDLHRNGFSRGGKADDMLKAHIQMLRNETRVDFPASRLRRVHTELCGRENW